MQEISKTKIGRYSLLGNKKHRQKERLFIAEGVKTFKDTIGAFRPEAIIVADEKLAEIIPAAYMPLVYKATRQEISRISGLATASDILAVYKLPECDINQAEPDKDSFNLVLDGVQDPGNFGTIIRTAHWFGIRNVYCSKETVDIYNPKTVQATMGSIASVNVVYTDLEELLLTHPDMPRYGLLLDGNDIFKEDNFEKGFIIMGNEGNGISPRLRELIDRPLTIPPVSADNHPDSLNVAIATAITLSQIVK